MNPAVPILLLVSLLPLARRRAGMPVAWCVAGFAAMLLLAPALLERQGVPSPAASAGAIPPWVGVLDPADGNPTLSDVTFQIQPWLLHLRAELRAGRLPFWNPYQFSGAPFWANGQSAPLHPLHLLFATLPLQLGFVVLPWLRATIAGVGAWALARELDVPPRESLVAAVVFPMSGMLSSFLLFPMANALCLVPWVLREVELLARRRGAWWKLAALVGLQALGGHPETVTHTAMLAALWVVARGPGDETRTGSGWAWRARQVGVVASAFVAGAAVAGVHLVPLALRVLESTRWQEWTPGERPPLGALADAALRAVLPDLFGHPAEGTWSGPWNFNATAVFTGVVALPLAAVGVVDRRGDARARAGLALTLGAALAAYQVFPVRELLLLVPVIEHMLHHRLLFAVDLGVALLAAAGLAALVRGRSRGLAAAAALVLVALLAAWARHHDAWREGGQLAHQAGWTAWALLALAGLALAARAARRASAGEESGGRRRGSGAGHGHAALAIATAVVLALAVELAAAHARTNPGLPIDSLLPRTGAIAFLAERDGRVAAIGSALRPNAAMVYGLRDVRGDDTLKSAAYEEVYRRFGGASPYFFEPIVDWGSPSLDRLGVRWVLAAAGTAPPVAEWTVAYDRADARIFERAGGQPLVRWSDGGTEGIRVDEAAPGRWRLAYETDRERTLVVAETWDAGWRGQRRDAAGSRLTAVELAPVEEILIGARLPPGSGVLRLRYRPPGLLGGAAASGCSVALMVLAAVRQKRSAVFAAVRHGAWRRTEGATVLPRQDGASGTGAGRGQQERG